MNSLPDERSIHETVIETVVENIMGGKKNVILDSQILTALMSCPRLSDFRFNMNLQSILGKSNSLECGSIVHTYLEFYYRCRIEGMSLDQAHQFGMAAAERYISGCKLCTGFVATPEFPKPPCGHKVDQFPGVKNTPKEPDKDNPQEKYKTGWAWVLDTCDQYYAFYRNDHWVPLYVEDVKSKVLYEDDEVRILWKAKIDIGWDTNQGIYPGDHKTMKQNRNNLTLNNQFKGQCLVSNTQKVMINKIGFQKTLPPDKKFMRPPMTYTMPRLLEWRDTILPYYSKLLIMYAETGYWPPNFDHCEGRYGKCSFVKVCEEDPDNRESMIKTLFVVGPEWNPTNDDDEGDE